MKYFLQIIYFIINANFNVIMTLLLFPKHLTVAKQTIHYDLVMIEIRQKISNLSINSSDQNSTQSQRGNIRRLSRSSNNKDSSRSISRESNSFQIAKFYVKNANFLNVEDSVEKSNREARKQKKREPTPCKSLKTIPSRIMTSPEKEKQAVLSSISIYQLQEKLASKQREVSRLMQIINIKEQKIKSLEKLAMKNDEKYKQFQTKNIEANARILTLEENLFRNDQCLKNNNNTIEKLKKSIQENRVQDLRKENEAYKKKINELNKQIEELIVVNRERQLKFVELEKQLSKAKKINENFKSESMKQVYLENEITKLRQKIRVSSQCDRGQLMNFFRVNEEQQTRLRNQVNKLMIKLDYLQRKHSKQLLLMSDIKSQEINKYRLKLARVQQQLRKKQKKQYSQIKIKNKRSVLQEKSQNVRECNTKRTGQMRKLSVSFQLSSDND